MLTLTHLSSLTLRYLQLVNPSEMVALEDSSGAVVSLPPLTNSENTKVIIILFQIPIPNSTDPFPISDTSLDSSSACIGGRGVQKIKINYGCIHICRLRRRLPIFFLKWHPQIPLPHARVSWMLWSMPCVMLVWVWGMTVCCVWSRWGWWRQETASFWYSTLRELTWLKINLLFLGHDL